MILRQNGLSFKYEIKIVVSKMDDLWHVTKVYSRYLKHNNQWHRCNIDLWPSGKLTISASTIDKDGKCFIGYVDKSRKIYEFKANYFNRNYIKLKEFFYNAKFRLFQFYYMKVRPIRINLILMFMVLIISLSYYYINEYYDNFLYNFISTNNLAQSILIFLSLATVVSLVHPFSFRRDTSVKETRKLISRNNKYISNKNKNDKKIEAGLNL